MFRQCNRGLLAVLCLFSFSDVLAQIAPPLNYEKNLSEVIVTATRSDTPLDQVPLNTTILTKEVLESSPDQTIDQVLKNVPGVFLNDVPYYQKDPTGQSINVRGLGYGRTLVLIDGLPANDAFYGTVQWSLVPMSSIDSVEFVRGGVSSLYGNYGMGGVININTRTPMNSQQEVSASYGTFNTSNVSASKDLIASDALQLRFSADSFNTDGYQNYASISPGSPSNIKNGMGTGTSSSSNVRLQSYFKPTQDTKGFFRVSYSSMSDLSNNYSIAPNLVQTTDIAGGTTTKLAEDKKVQVNVFFQDTNFFKQTANNLTASPYKPYINANYTDPYTTLGGSAQYTHDLKMAGVDQYIVGIDARNISASNQTNNLSSTGSGAVSSVNYAQGQQNFYGLLGQVKSSMASIPLEATLGARVDNWNSQTPTYYNATAGSTPTYQTIANQSKTQLSPSLGLMYKATQDLDFRTAAYQAFHAPSMNNTLRSYGNSVSGYSLANPNLTPETMTGYEVGSDYRWRGGFAQLTAFSNYIQNAIASYKITNANSAYASSLCSAAGISGCAAGSSGYTNVSYYTNQQNLLSRGLELQYQHEINPHWMLDGGYSYTRTILTWTATTDPTGTQVGGVPMSIANAGVTYYPVPQASLTTTVRYVGNSWMSTGSLPVPAYAIVGLKANYQVTPQATVFASIVNLFNRQYVTFNIASQASSYQAGMPQAINVGARITF
ncbi:TonB-dependent receptor [Polynucleobacter paneuropaeus]|jgi:iron complex outermembrane receptor protein|uniref:TonB-dependent receptor n=1 Tax=Polynucleobacter paneuropaeus TaxID=2527775 RepID=UPI001BFD34E7|nr:TonB-dependent receptor [Polynucleobacter paneuropaeus]MBT8523652.1 TonB-dependent receptor [Polynucleobacter paneuropaeus]MBT8526790.1 TonB-dependent receptor [Polynucleobacter paneuropaeus]MBT8533452.1 TonB-dependent receptor [Polynucleobacter paneuropaeus]MBT8605242.1 TonB-dependent receptor [Polynucleobacter paneuropaeus]MBT8615516.1 TonB-dependent receptor [Polynucleobacter paneuropaeus]